MKFHSHFPNSWADHVILYLSNSSGEGNLNGYQTHTDALKVNAKFQLSFLSFLVNR